MVFAYYKRLNRAQRKTYRDSDRIGAVPLPGAEALQSLVAPIERALAGGTPAEVRRCALALVEGITRALAVPPVRLRVLERRPSDEWGELHGYYEPEDPPRPARISVWMRTARRQQRVAFRSFLRTLLHELCHHLDYELLGLDETFHTEGFYQRESSLFHQLLPEAGGAARFVGRAAGVPADPQD